MDKRLKMSKALYILEANLHGIMTVPKTYKDYSSNSNVQVTIYMEYSGIMIDVKQLSFNF